MNVRERVEVENKKNNDSFPLACFPAILIEKEEKKERKKEKKYR